jgi:hypothetical protein
MAQADAGLSGLSLEQLLGLRALLQKMAGRPQMQGRRAIGPPGPLQAFAHPTPPRPAPPPPLQAYSGPLTRGALQGLAPPAAPGLSAFQQPSVLAGLVAAPRRRQPRPQPLQRRALGY